MTRIWTCIMVVAVIGVNWVYGSKECIFFTLGGLLGIVSMMCISFDIIRRHDVR